MAYDATYRKVKLNSAQCLICREILVSKTTHDLNTCKCGNLSVDGGNSYVKRSLHDGTKYKELSQYVGDPLKETKNEV